MEWDKAFREYLKKLDESKPIIYCGDLNVAHNPIGGWQYVQSSEQSLYEHRFCCHGNTHLNDDSTSQRSISIALHDSKTRRRMWRAECV